MSGRQWTLEEAFWFAVAVGAIFWALVASVIVFVV